MSHLFTIDDLVNDLPNLGIGCFWGSHLVGALGHADDVVSLAPSPAALRMMLCCCKEFANKHTLQFN